MRHLYAFQSESGKYAIRTFDHILLSGSGIDEPSSHGFAKFSISIKSNAPHQTIIENSASIYFDFNPPIHANKAQVPVDLTSGIQEQEFLLSSVFPNPTAGTFTLTLNRQAVNFDVESPDLSGKSIQKFENLSGNRVLLNIGNLENGIYFHRILRRNRITPRGKAVVAKSKSLAKPSGKCSRR